jgi:ABC-2 type transport system permease protein
VRKYLYLTRLSFERFFEYRVNLAWKIAGTLVWTPILFAFWATILSAGFGRDKYTIYSLAVYYIAISFISLVNQFNANVIANEVRKGDISADLLKPYSYFWKYFLRFLPDKVILLGLFILVNIALALSGISHTTAMGLSVALISILLAMLMRLYLSLFFGGLSFWFKRVHGFSALLFNIGGIFSGDLIPVDLLPAPLLKIANFLPFRFMAYVPAKLTIQQPSFPEGARSIIAQLVWVGLFYLLAKIIWKRGIDKYEAVGN